LLSAKKSFPAGASLAGDVRYLFRDGDTAMTADQLARCLARWSAGTGSPSGKLPGKKGLECAAWLSC